MDRDPIRHWAGEVDLAHGMGGCGLPRESEEGNRVRELLAWETPEEGRRRCRPGGSESGRRRAPVRAHLLVPPGAPR